MGWEGAYEVSSLGRVRSLDRVITDRLGRTHTRKGKIRKLQVKVDGHIAVDLKKNNFRKTYQVHRLMAKSFLPNPHGLPLVRPLNDEPGDNRIENLAWGDKSDNGNDAVRNGKHFWANRTSCSQGHPYQGDSFYDSGRQRVCRVCRRNIYGVKEPTKHGTYSGYVTFGCRCKECVEAGAKYRKERYDKSKIDGSR